MNTFTKPYLFRASLLAGAAIFMGLALSFVVYHSTERVKRNAVDLVGHRIPILISVNELIADLSEQERIVYEYYSSQDTQKYLQESSDISDTFAMHFSVLLTQSSFSKDAEYIAQGQQNIEQLLATFHQKMELQVNNWDELRDLLAKVSTARLDLLPVLHAVEQKTQQIAEEGHQATLYQMKISHQLVIGYGIAILLIAGVVSWYIRQYIFAQQKISRLAFYNQETNLPNQYKFNQDIDALLNQHNTFVVGVFTIRSFNDKLNTLGLTITSDLINSLSKIIIKVLPEGIRLYQISDRLFGLLCTKNTHDLALKKLTQVITNVAEKSIVIENGEFFVELDFGFNVSANQDDDRNSLLKNAHVALSLASNDAHENYYLYQPALIEDIQRNAQLIDALRYAIAKQELFLVFQPQLNLATNQITGIETLVRWQHGSDVISPAEFIPLAEQSGLIVPIGEWILRKACLFAKQLVDLGYLDIVVAVNVSPRQFSHPQFYHMVQHVLEEVNLPPKNLELEVTEGVFMHNEEGTLNVLRQLKSLGVQLSIDDFGTGYSSLSYLKRFPINKLKIDQSFIRDSHRNDEDKAIIATIVSLGKSLQLTLIAEGVEEQEHVDFLTSLHCDEIQGYWFSKPIKPEELIELLAKRFEENTHESDYQRSQISVAT